MRIGKIIALILCITIFASMAVLPAEAAGEKLMQHSGTMVNLKKSEYGYNGFSFGITKYSGNDVVVLDGYYGDDIEVTIPEMIYGYPVVLIDDAFKNCDSITSVTIPNSIINIGNEAFKNCTSLKNVVIPDSVLYIGWASFMGCTSLTDIVIPRTVKTIESSTFSGCEKLTSITIPDSVTSIGKNAFYNCSGHQFPSFKQIKM